MALTEAEYRQIEHCFPVPRGNVSISNLTVLNAVLYVAETNCNWRRLPRHFGNWHTVYTRMRRWSRNGVLDRVFTQLQHVRILRIVIEVSAVDTLQTHAATSGVANDVEVRQPAHAPSAKRQLRFVWLPRPTEFS